MSRGRGPRRKSDLRRRSPARSPYKRALIACEDSQSAPRYFRDLCDDCGINPANVLISGDCGSDPDSVVAHAIELFQQDGDFDDVFCVFDRDTHPSFNGALERCRTKILRQKDTRAPVTIRPITSVPSFEYWLLLHYENTTALFEGAGNQSAAQRLVQRVRTHIGGYAKGMTGVYQLTKPNLESAIERAESLEKQVEVVGVSNPSTRIHELINYLRNLISDS